MIKDLTISDVISLIMGIIMFTVFMASVILGVKAKKGGKE